MDRDNVASGYAAIDGHFVMLEPLEPGEHVIHYGAGASSPGVFNDATADIMVRVPGDFDGDTLLTALDMDLLSAEIDAQPPRWWFDLDSDGAFTEDDRVVWVHDLKRTYFGDANLDGLFDASDMVQVFQGGEYEDSVALNSTWDEGDWSGDGEFDSADLVLAFQDGGYEQGPRAGVNAVPEPSSTLMLILACVGMSICRRRGSEKRAP